ncbi:MAG: MotA/TolQ/ExbB proton channel family protein [Puniceicoccales bacterium]|nr:MotA/TolQ/ExbB proton channel family protein [Puniceicoccales bacterium]
MERLFALRNGRIVPDALLRILAQGNPPALPPALERTIGGRIVRFFQRNNPDPDTLKAYAQLELTRLERGIFLLDTIVSAAPLIGLLGTVWGLFSLFPEEGMPAAATLTRGVGMALITTMLGLCIAIPALLGSSYISRRLEVLSARINIAVERLCSFCVGAEPSVSGTVKLPPLLPLEPVKTEKAKTPPTSAQKNTSAPATASATASATAPASATPATTAAASTATPAPASAAPAADASKKKTTPVVVTPFYPTVAVSPAAIKANAAKPPVSSVASATTAAPASTFAAVAPTAPASAATSAATSASTEAEPSSGITLHFRADPVPRK